MDTILQGSLLGWGAMSFNRTVSRLGLQTFLLNFSGPLNQGPMVWSEMAPKGLPHPVLGR